MAEQLPLPALYDGHDAGHYTLPDDVVKARDTYRAVAAMPYPQPPRNAWETVQDVATATVDALHNSRPLPDVELIEQARRAERVYQDALDMLGGALDLAAQRTRGALREHSTVIITDHLRPALDEMWQTYKGAHRTLVEYGQTEPRHLLSAPAKVRKASDTCDAMADRYTAIAGARGQLGTVLGVTCPDDPRGKYTLLRNYHQLHPSRMANGRTPWHDMSVRHYLDYMASRGGQMWMPTPDEQAQAVEAEAHIGQPGRVPGAIRVPAA